MFARRLAAGLHLARLSEGPCKRATLSFIAVTPYYTRKRRVCQRGRGKECVDGRMVGVLHYRWGFVPSRKEQWRLAFALFAQKGVMIVTAYEIIVVVIMIITLSFSIHNGNHKG